MNQAAHRRDTGYQSCMACLLVLDVSGRTVPQPGDAPESCIDELRRGLNLLSTALRSNAGEAANIRLAILQGGGSSRSAELLLDWAEAGSFEPPPLHRSGANALAKAMRHALYHVDRLRQELVRSGTPHARPWIVVISDGGGVDTQEGWARAAEECLAAQKARRCTILPIAVNGRGREQLQKLSVTRVADAGSAQLGHCFDWLSKSLLRLSQARPGLVVELPSTDKWATFPQEAHS